jgi:hypothetical protein
MVPMMQQAWNKHLPFCSRGNTFTCLCCALQRENYPKSYEDWYLILLQCQNCGVEGEGRIDAQGARWVYGGCATSYSACAQSVVSSDCLNPGRQFGGSRAVIIGCYNEHTAV